MPPLRVDPITDYQAFRSLEPIWNSLLERTDTDVPFLTHEWLSAWWESFGAGARMRVLVVRRGADPVALAPLMVDATRRRLSFMANAYSMRAGCLVAEEPEASLRAIFDHLTRSGLKWDEMVLNYLPEDSTTARLAARACPEHGLRFGQLPSLISPYVSFDGRDWDQYLAGLNARFRKNLLYAERRLLQRESARAALHSDPGAVEQALDACREVALTSWQHEQGTSIASSPRVWAFYRRFADLAAARGWLRIGLLEAAGRPIAFKYNLLYRQTMYALKIGYTPQFANRSPGHVLQAFMIRQAMAEMAQHYDLLGMNDPYKMRWATGERRHTCLCVAGRGVKPALRHWLQFVARPRLRQWRPAMAAKQWLDAHRSRARPAREGGLQSG